MTTFNGAPWTIADCALPTEPVKSYWPATTAGMPMVATACSSETSSPSSRYNPRFRATAAKTKSTPWAGSVNVTFSGGVTVGTAGGAAAVGPVVTGAGAPPG